MYLAHQLFDWAFVFGAFEQQGDVINHVLVRDEVQELPQRLGGLTSKEPKFCD